MVVTASPETYYHLLEYGMYKTRLRIDRLLLQAFMAGVYVGLAGHCCTTVAGGFSVDPGDPLAVSKSAQKLIYGMIFPVSFISIIWTGAELFTGNTMTMLVCILEKRIQVYQLLINWFSSLTGNWLGALFVAYFLSYLTGALEDKNVLHFLYTTAGEKTSYSFGACFLRAVGCNTFVCLAVWFVTAADDAAGKVITLWFPILAFCVGGYEHIIANFYTLQTALIAGAPVSLGEVIVNNFIPTLLGNLVGGCCLIGAVCWYNFYPTVIVREHLGDTFPGLAVQAINLKETDEEDLDPNKSSHSIAVSLSAAGASQGLLGSLANGDPPQKSQNVQRYSIVGSSVGTAPLGGPPGAPSDSSGVVLLPKECFGGKYLMNFPHGGPANAANRKPFSLLPASFRTMGSKVSQARSATDVSQDAQQSYNAPAAPDGSGGDNSPSRENFNV